MLRRRRLVSRLLPHTHPVRRVRQRRATWISLDGHGGTDCRHAVGVRRSCRAGRVRRDQRERKLVHLLLCRWRQVAHGDEHRAWSCRFRMELERQVRVAVGGVQRGRQHVLHPRPQGDRPRKRHGGRDLRHMDGGGAGRVRGDAQPRDGMGAIRQHQGRDEETVRVARWRRARFHFRGVRRNVACRKPRSRRAENLCEGRRGIGGAAAPFPHLRLRRAGLVRDGSHVLVRHRPSRPPRKAQVDAVRPAAVGVVRLRHLRAGNGPHRAAGRLAVSGACRRVALRVPAAGVLREDHGDGLCAAERRLRAPQRFVRSAGGFGLCAARREQSDPRLARDPHLHARNGCGGQSAAPHRAEHRAWRNGAHGDDGRISAGQHRAKPSARVARI